MKLNESLIPHYHCEPIPIDILSKKININREYLQEKSTWYEINSRLKYFKIRNDLRIFSEKFFSIFGKEIANLDTIDYQVALVTSRNIVKSTKEKKLGLLSDNFQKPGFNYFLVSELLNTDVSDLRSYGDYSLINLLRFFRDLLTNECYSTIQQFLINLFICDAFTFQKDRNYHNIGFEIPRIADLSYKQRLRPNLLANDVSLQNFVVKEDGMYKIPNLVPTKVYDNERILGLDHKNVIHYYPGMAWQTIFPFNPELKFESQEEADKVKKQKYDGLDPNLTELYLNFPNEAKPLMERLAYDDEYRKILEYFSSCKNNSVCLDNNEEEIFTKVLEDRRKEFQKILKI